MWRSTVAALEVIRGALLPARCLQCAASLREAAPLCLSCFRLLESCRIPARELPGLTVAGRPVIAASYYRSASPLRAVHRAAKYHQNEGCANWLARYMARRIHLPEGVEVCTPVPSHPARLMDRGLDLAGILSQTLANRTNQVVSLDLLRRHTLGTPQDELDRSDRLSNVESVFKAGKQTPSPLHVLLVDDVVTTGATLDACASVLEAKGHTVALAALAFRREIFRLSQR